MKNFTVLLSLLMIASCNQSTEETTQEQEQTSIAQEVKVTAVESDLKCHICPGFIIIRKGDKVDTLKYGSWGKPTNHIYFKKERQFPRFFFSAIQATFNMN